MAGEFYMYMYSGGSLAVSSRKKRRSKSRGLSVGGSVVPSSSELPSR